MQYGARVVASALALFFVSLLIPYLTLRHQRFPRIRLPAFIDVCYDGGPTYTDVYL
jgi:hypothetical protein